MNLAGINQNLHRPDGVQFSPYSTQQAMPRQGSYQSGPIQPSLNSLPTYQNRQDQSSRALSQQYENAPPQQGTNSEQPMYLTQQQRQPSSMKPASPGTANENLVVEQCRQGIKQRNVHRHVQRFIANLKSTITKNQVPSFVKPSLDTYMYEWQDTSALGWSPWRWDVLILDGIMTGADITAIFFFTAHLVLYQTNVKIFSFIYLGLLLLRIIYKLNTQVLIQSKAIIRKVSIRWNYIWNHLIIDVLLIVLCFLEFFGVHSSVYRLVILLSLIDIRRNLRQFEALLSRYHTALIIYQMITIFMYMILVAHSFAILLIVIVSDAVVPNWMAAVNLTRHQHNWWTAYLYAFYWSTTMMMTIGFGDLLPKNTKEVVFVMLIEMLSVLALAYLISAIQVLFKNIRQHEDTRQQNLVIINRYFRINKVPYEIQADVKEVVSNMAGTVIISQIQEQNKLIAEITSDLKQKLLISVNFQYMVNMPFWNRFTKSSVEAIIVDLQRKLYYHTEELAVQGAVPDRLYMLREGCLVAFISNKKDEELQVDELFQQNILDSKKYLWVLLEQAIRQIPSPVTIRSQYFSMVMSISVESVMEILRENKMDYESYCFFRDNLIVNHMDVHQKKCQLCPQLDHSTLQCPYFHFMPKRDIVITKYIRNQGVGKQIHNKRRRKIRPRDSWLRSYLKSEHTKKIYWRLSQRSLQSMTDLDKKKNLDNISEQLTTLHDVDMVYEWRIYYKRFNLSEIVS